MAEKEGFEPSIRYRIHTFQACAIDHSAISPIYRFPCCFWEPTRIIEIGFCCNDFLTDVFFGQRFQLIPTRINLLQLGFYGFQFVQGFGNSQGIFFIKSGRTDLLR